MNIAILTSNFYHEVEEIHGRDRIIYGGAERYLVDLCKFLQAEGHKVTVFQQLPDSKKTDKQVTKVYDGIPIVCLPDAEGSWDYYTNPKLNMTFNEVALSFDLRIYFATFLCFPHVVRPAIAISHGIFWDYPYSPYMADTLQVREEFSRRLVQSFTAPDVVVSVDSNVRKVMAALHPGVENRIEVVYNYVDTKQFTPGQKDWDEMRVLFPRRLTTIRGCNEFILASRELRQYAFLACGQSAHEGIQSSTTEWGATTDNLRFIYQSMDNMAAVYQQCDISVIPTRCSEGLSLSLLESMACGLPVITTPVGGLGDAVIPGYNALVVDLNHENLAPAIDYLAQDADLRAIFGRRNREIAQCFDIEVWKRRWRAIIG